MTMTRVPAANVAPGLDACQRVCWSAVPRRAAVAGAALSLHAAGAAGAYLERPQ